MKSQYEFFFAACLFGFNNAPLQALSRSTLASLIPCGKVHTIVKIYDFV
jgi:MFS-type transporter involved in bile tolerance (Atg22 family)